jgi:pimeloyl-ACP methyl ester carboxylesterase
MDGGDPASTGGSSRRRVGRELGDAPMIRPGPVVQPLFEHRAEWGGYSTRVLELEGSGPPILMFHGFADSADTWRLALATLARQGQRAVAVDLPGFGEADSLDSGPILPQLDAFAADAIRYVGGRPRQPALLVGNSLGGCVALRAAERPGARLAGVLAAAPAGLQMSRLLFLVERDPVLRSILALPAPVPSMVLRATVARLYVQLVFASSRNVDPGVISTFTSHLRSRPKVASYLGIAHRLLPELRNALELNRVHCPLRLVWGDRDRLLFARAAQQILDAVPGSRLELLSQVGHCPQVEAPERFTAILLDFVQELGSAEPAWPATAPAGA